MLAVVVGTQSVGEPAEVGAEEHLTLVTLGRHAGHGDGWHRKYSPDATGYDGETGRHATRTRDC